MADHVTWDDPGGVLIPMPPCANCGHPETAHTINPKKQRTRCTWGPISPLVVQCKCARYRTPEEQA